MGIQENLTEHALGRSPYDDVVTGEGEGEKAQKYDNRGRPINPETKRINREIFRAHNEVMLVIGVAETKSHHGGDLEPQGRHAAHEETIGLCFASPAKCCIESAGVFGIHGLRQRILIYKRYSHIPFWDLLKKSRKESFLTRNILAGAPTSLITNYIDLFLKRRYPDERGTPLRHIAHYAWIFFDLHLELYVALQRLGLIPNLLMTPSLKFFVPFTEMSPLQAPAAPIDFSASSLLRWLGAAIVSAAPFIAWSLATRLIYDAKPIIWSSFFERLPSTIFQAKTTSQALSSRLLRSSTISEFHHEAIQEASQQQNLDGHDTFRQPGGSHPQEMDSGDLTDRTGSWAAVAESASAGYTADEYTSSEDDSEVVSATLISFDVEAAEPADVSPGLWSAELRPSAAQDSKSGAGQSVLYCDTLLTQLPALIGSHVFTDSLSRLLFIPSEAVVLRLIAWSLRQRQGLACEDILPVRLFGGVTWPYALNLAATEFFHLAVCSVMWAGFSALSVRYHRTEEEWLADEARTLERKSG